MWGKVKFMGTSVTGLEEVSVLQAERVETFLACVEVKIRTCPQLLAMESPSTLLPARTRSTRPSGDGEAEGAASPSPPAAEDALHAVLRALSVTSPTVNSTP